MVGKQVFTRCDEHVGCTQVYDFTAQADESQVVAIPARVRNALANSDFPADVCVGVTHLTGQLSIKRVGP